MRNVLTRCADGLLNLVVPKTMVAADECQYVTESRLEFCQGVCGYCWRYRRCQVCRLAGKHCGRWERCCCDG